MTIPFTPATILSALAIGVWSAYLAHKRGRNPYFWFAIGLLFGVFGIYAIFFSKPIKKSVGKPAPATPVYHIQGPSDKFWYYLDGANQQQGPMSHDAMTAAWRGGRIERSTYIWHEDLSDWKPLQDFLKAEGVV